MKSNLQLTNKSSFRFRNSSRLAAVGLVSVTMALSGTLCAATKDVVLDRVVAPIQSSSNSVAAAVVGDAMVVSVLRAELDGTLTANATNALFRTGERFHLKVLASRNGTIEVHNTNPLGQRTERPLWTGEVRVGEETITPRFSLTGNRGVDQVHVVLLPKAPEGGLFAWLRDVLDFKGKSTRKDVVLDTQNTPSNTYVLNSAGQGITATINVVHQ